MPALRSQTLQLWHSGCVGNPLAANTQHRMQALLAGRTACRFSTVLQEHNRHLSP